ncbi:MAG: ATP-binding protein [Gammaproteobacteria bacterium]
MKKEFQRALSNLINTAMQDTPVVLINGPRQAGKTTLVQQYAPSLPFYSLDDENILNAVQQDPMGFIENIDRAIIDEIQRAPGLLRAIKLSVDQNRKPGRFLLTGSANLLALPQVGDSLAGRMEVLTLLPLSLAEIKRQESCFLKVAQSQSWPTVLKQADKFDYITYLLMGGYPEMITRANANRRSAWARAYIKAIVERDVRDISAIEKLVEMPYFLEILAEQSGKQTNFTLIGSQLKIDTKTAQKYVGLLENLFLVKRLRPWHGNHLSRLIKTPKLYFLDSGLLASLNRITLARIEKDKGLVGPLLETWVYSELLKSISINEEPWDVFYYRDKDQMEVDFVLEDPEKNIIGVEVKASSTVFNNDFHGLKKLSLLVGKKWLSGIVLYNGHHCLSFGDNLWAIPLSMLGGK